jgi:hypothetical protein
MSDYGDKLDVRRDIMMMSRDRSGSGSHGVVITIRCSVIMDKSDGGGHVICP